MQHFRSMDVTGDGVILERFREEGGQEEAFRLLVGKYREKLYWHIRKLLLCHEDTDDVLQDVFVKIWKGLGRFRGESGLYTWMFRIATNESLNFLEEKRRKVHGNAEGISDYLANTLKSDPFFSGDEVQREFQQALLTLTDRQRMVFNMRYYDSLPYDEMAELLGVASGTLKATYHNAVRKIEAGLGLADTIK